MILYYFGDRYYQESGSVMGVLYDKSYFRYDWGKVQCELREGKQITIKPATKQMLTWADRQLRYCRFDKIKL